MDDFTATYACFDGWRRGRIVRRWENRCSEAGSREKAIVHAVLRIAFIGRYRAYSALLECRLFPESILWISNYCSKPLFLASLKG